MKFEKRDAAVKKLIARKVVTLLQSGETLKSIAARVGVTHPSIIHARDGKSGLEMQIRFADAYWGGSFDALVADAVAVQYQKASSVLAVDVVHSEPVLNPATNAYVAASDGYVERERAAQAARVLGSVSEDAIARVQTFVYPSNTAGMKVTADEWLAKMQAAEQDIRSVLAKEL